MIKKVLIFGSGYVGFSLAVLFASKIEVTIIDLDLKKIRTINNGESPIKDSYLEAGFNIFKHKITAVPGIDKINLSIYDICFLALPTNYDEVKNFFDTKALESVIYELSKLKFASPIIIKSTIPIGFTEYISKQFKNLDIFFAPEFLREGTSLQDNENPSRIIIGTNSQYNSNQINNISNFLKSFTHNNPSVLIMSSSEAESVKLFANSFLALRVAFFNELDNFALTKKLSSRNIIDGISLDERIGNYYNNPSFGYGGYCFPKDTKQMLANFEDIPQSIFTSIVRSNELRKEFIANEVLNRKPNIIGIYRLIMKSNSDNFRYAAVIDLINILKSQVEDVLVYEPLLSSDNLDFHVIHDLTYFKATSDIIIANRMDSELIDVAAKVFTRDIYGEN